jgi:hypothetical protein
MVVGIGAGFLVDCAHFDSEFIDNDFDVFASAGLVGVILCFIGLIGWCRRLARERRVLMALSVFIAPWIVLLLSYLTVGVHLHGSAAPVIMLIFPATILAVILLIVPSVKALRP